MNTKEVVVDGQSYAVAPLDPELWDHPSPAYPVAVTPEVARNWLNYNYRNRNQREKGKADYSADMAERNFALNGATVTFSRPLADGEDELVPAGKPVLMDGQHRLTSCVRSGNPFVTYVAYGLNPEVRATIDSGIKRSFGDALQLAGETNTLVLAAVVRRVHAWTNGDTHLTMKRGTSTHSQLLEFLYEHPELRRSAKIATRTFAEFHLTTGHALRQANVGLAHWLFMRADQTMAPEFFARLGDGANMPLQHPIMRLRRRLVKDLTVKIQERGGTRRDIPYVPDWQQLCYFIRTWNQFVVWEQSTEQEREEFKEFALLGSRDAERIPRIALLKESVEALNSGATDNESSDENEAA